MSPRYFLISAALLVAGASNAEAFWAGSSGPASTDLRGNLRWLALATAPLDDDLPSGLESHAVFLRGIGEVSVSDWFSSELHLLEVVSGSNGSSVALPTFDLAFRGGERNRSAALSWTQAQGTYASALLEVDRLNLRFTARPFDITVGRQPISLATAYLFTPNDFFAPFFAQTFYRVYKPGVDAARIDAELGEFSGASLYGVLGYKHGAEPEASDPVSLEESSLVGRVYTNLFDVLDVSLLGGVVSDFWLIGGGFQGELFEWLGIRGEGHVTLSSDPLFELSLGLEHRFESSLHLRFEYFYHGAGATDPAGYLQAALAPAPGELPYFGRHYTAFAASYELSALLTGDVLVLVNWIDPSAYATAYLVYSLLDEAELALSVATPIGRGPSGSLEPSVGPAGELVLPNTIKSEFGLYPMSFNIELRVYF